MSLPQSFLSKKRKILDQLSIPDSKYDDLSPKGSIDVGIRDLIDEINTIEGCVTTSSCAGRISVFLEGKKTPETYHDGDLEAERGASGVGGKGGGGRWLFVSHDPVDIEGIEKREKRDGVTPWTEFLGMEVRWTRGASRMIETPLGESRFVHFKFEPLILHVLTASLQQAQNVLSAALQAGFRESGALNLTSSTAEQATPMVGIRSMGLAFESLVGFEVDGKGVAIIPDSHLKKLVEIANERFKENTKRIERFRMLLKEIGTETGEGVKRKGQDSEEWEDAQARRERKRAEGLKKAEAMKKADASQETEEVFDMSILEENT